MSLMDQQAIFNIAITACGALGGWWLKVIWDSLKELERADRALVDRVAAIDVLVAGSYVKRDYFEQKMESISHALFAKLDKIDEKLDKKADRPHQ
jgi:hypothetical protein